MKHLIRKCAICGKDINVIHYEDRSYKGGHFFKVLKLPTGEGEHVSLGWDSELDAEIVDWTGDYYEFEYWECDDCYFDEPIEKDNDGDVEHLCPDCGKEAARCPVGHWLCFECGWQTEGCDHPEHKKKLNIMELRGKFPKLTLEGLRDEDNRY